MSGIFHQKWFRGSLIATALVLPLLGLGLRGGLARAYGDAMSSPGNNQANVADAGDADGTDLADADDTDGAIAAADPSVDADSADDATTDDLVADMQLGDDADMAIAANLPNQDDADQ